jgi:7,8-dihydropterin-6-yl-methyl-4-(beta-D-ribofuranosyl)aminobenzene 5'-phosphate synthase
MDIRITVISENTVGTSLPVVGEHGFAVFIETKKGDYLFDTGQGLSILRNAKHFKKDLTSIKKIFLSHGHYDHTGGLPQVLRLTKKAEVLAHPDIFSKKYARMKINGRETEKYIGIRHTMKYFEKRGALFRLNRNFCEVDEGIYLTGEVPRTTDFEKGDLRLLVNENGNLVPDPLLDDQSLILKTTNGLIVVLGCAHSGLINTIKHVMSHFKDEKLDTIIGGTHLGFLKKDQLDQTILHLKHYNFEKIGVAHCTGLNAALRLFQEFQDKFFLANVGASIVVDEWRGVQVNNQYIKSHHSITNKGSV